MRKLLGTLLAISVLGSCTSLPTLPPPDARSLQAWQNHDAQLEKLNQWSIRGRFSLQSAEETWTGMLQWHTQQNKYRVQLSSPLGQGMIRLSGDQHGALLELSNGAQYRDDNAETLFSDRLGWHFPLSSLLHWIIGRPQLQQEYSYTLTPKGNITKLHQQNWVIIYKEYYNDLSPVLPRRLVLTNQNLRIKLVVDRWTDLDDSSAT